MRKIALLALILVGLSVPASAQCIYCGGSYEPGLVPWRGQTSLGPWGIQRPHAYYYQHGAHGGGRGTTHTYQRSRMRLVPMCKTVRHWSNGRVQVFVHPCE